MIVCPALVDQTAFFARCGKRCAYIDINAYNIEYILSSNFSGVPLDAG